MKLTTSILLVFVSYIFLLTSCDTTEPKKKEKPKAGIELQIENVNCTEARVKVNIETTTLPIKFELYQCFNKHSNNDSTIITANINRYDTTLIVNNLLPNKTYTFTASIKTSNFISNTLTVTTADTTSHNFTWESFRFGDRGSSELYDVAIINENNIWAVGNIHTEDTGKWNADSTKWLTPYNAVHWDGNTWELKRIMFYIDPFQPDAGRTASIATSIFAFDENDFIISSNVQMAFFNVANSYRVAKMNFKWENLFTINSIWGTSSKDFYVVGNGGNIAHYNGSSWAKIESDTDLNIKDIWGDYNSATGKWEVLAAARAYSEYRTAILQITNSRAVSHPIADIGNVLLGTTWFLSNKVYYVSGMETYKKQRLDGKPWGENNSLDPGGWPDVHKIRGNNFNDIITAGGFGAIMHYNGVSWKSYYNKTKLGYGNYNSVTIKNDLVVAVGYDNVSGAIIIGKR